MFRPPPVFAKRDPQPQTIPARPLSHAYPAVEPSVQSVRKQSTTGRGSKVAGLASLFNVSDPAPGRPSFRDSQAGSWRRSSKDLRRPSVPELDSNMSAQRPDLKRTDANAVRLSPERPRGFVYGTESPRLHPERSNPFKRRDSSGSEISQASVVARRDSLSRKAFERVRSLSPPIITERRPTIQPIPSPPRVQDETIEAYIHRRLTARWSPAASETSSTSFRPRATASSCPHVDAPFVLDILRTIDHILTDHTTTLRAVIAESETLLHEKEHHCQTEGCTHIPPTPPNPTVAQPTPLTASFDEPIHLVRQRTSSYPALLEYVDDTVSEFGKDLSEGEQEGLKPVRSLSRRSSESQSVVRIQVETPERQTGWADNRTPSAHSGYRHTVLARSPLDTCNIPTIPPPSPPPSNRRKHSLTTSDLNDYNRLKTPNIDRAMGPSESFSSLQVEVVTPSSIETPSSSENPEEDLPELEQLRSELQGNPTIPKSKIPIRRKSLFLEALPYDSESDDQSTPLPTIVPDPTPEPSPSPGPSSLKKLTRRISTSKSSKALRGAAGGMKTKRPLLPTGALYTPIVPETNVPETPSRVAQGRGFWGRNDAAKAKAAEGAKGRADARKMRSDRGWLRGKRVTTTSGEVDRERAAGP